jgi:hypothetical protein
MRRSKKNFLPDTRGERLKPRAKPTPRARKFSRLDGPEEKSHRVCRREGFVVSTSSCPMKGEEWVEAARCLLCFFFVAASLALAVFAEKKTTRQLRGSEERDEEKNL